MAAAAAALLALVLSLAPSLSGAERAGDKDLAQAPSPAVAPPDPNPLRLRFVYIPEKGSEKMREKFTPFKKHMSQTLGMDIELICPETYEETYDILARKEFEVAYFTPLAYVEASELADLEPAVMEYYREDGEGYHSILLARNASFESKNREGLVLAYTNVHSTSGYLMPQYYFHNVINQPAESIVSETVMAGTHREVILGLADGRYDLGATNDVDLALMVEAGEVDPGLFTRVWTSDGIPGSVFCVRPSLSAQRKYNIKRAILALNRDYNMLDRLGINGYMEAGHYDYSVMFELKKYFLD